MYVMEKCTAGKTIEITRYHTSRFGKQIPRGKNRKKTPEDVAAVNQRNAEKKLRRLINANFGKNDIHLVLTYKKDERPDPEEAREDLKKFLKEMRKYHKKKGTIFKYIVVTEYKRSAIHHHLIINSVDMRDVQDMWKKGKARPTFLDDSGQYGQLASYLIKETSKTFKSDEHGPGKRYSCSRNLEKPEIKKKIIPAKSWRKEPKPIPGYWIEKDSMRSGICEYNGYPYQFYRMIRIEEPRGKLVVATSQQKRRE